MFVWSLSLYNINEFEVSFFYAKSQTCSFIEKRIKTKIQSGSYSKGDLLFMLIMDLLLPFTMISFGRYFMKKAPKKINTVFGSRR